MLEIKGKVNTAICYAKVIEDVAIEQIRRMCDYGLTEGSKIRIMPDVHAGKGCTVGTTMTVKDKACPNIVGVDIGCGMYTVKLAEKEVDFVATRGDEKLYIQASYDLSMESTLTREAAPLLEIRDAYPKLIIASTHQPEYLHEGIRVLDIADWLLEE